MLRIRRPGLPRPLALLGVGAALLAFAAPGASAQGGAPGAELAAVSSPGAPARAEAAASFAELDRRIAEIDDLLAEAHFHTALALARSMLDQLPGGAEQGPRRARLEVMAATAEIALDRRSEARSSLERASRADPTLVFDDRELSPKLLELVPPTRRRAGVAEDLP